MDYSVSSNEQPIDFGATGTAEILQNVRMILATPESSCPLDRDFAWSPDIDAPINIVKARQTSRIVAAIQKYEPRAEVIRVDFQADGLNGVLKPIVKVRIADGTI